ncbi:glycosyltransferase [Croceiramulus getboli]|nr:glycosyltransferase family 2 protein [Flavobacteriaceae bacterium YJPT1-3]
MLAIVIPYYKPNFFEDCLKSLASQSCKEFKVYIGDDNSPNDPKPVINKYREVLDIHYRRYQDNLGEQDLVRHWSRCIELIGSEQWIMVLCDDDVLDYNVVESFYDHVKRIDAMNINVVRFASQEINHKGEIISKRFVHEEILAYSDVFFNRFFNHFRSSLSEHIFRKSIYEKKGFRNIQMAWYADDLAWLEFSCFGCIYSINEASVYFRYSDFNISRNSYKRDTKYLLRHNFFDIVVSEFLFRFKPEHQKRILAEFEKMTYHLNKADFQFWKINILRMIRVFSLWEGLKFTRRVYLNRRK